MAKRFVIRIMTGNSIVIDQPCSKDLTKEEAIAKAERLWDKIPLEEKMEGDSYACVLRAELDDDFDNYDEAVEKAEEIWLKDMEG